MDEEYLELLFKRLDFTEATIKGTATYCSLNYNAADKIAQQLTQALYQSRKDRKLLFLYVIYEIIEESKKKNHDHFVRAIGYFLKQICEHFATNIDKFEDMKNVRSIISKWQQTQVFDPSYCEKLQRILLPHYKELYIEQNKLDQQKKSNKYDKSFLTNYQLIKGNELTKNLYNQLAITNENTTKIDQFQSNSRNDFLDNATNEVLEKLLAEAQSHKTLLKKQIQNYQSLYEEVSNKSLKLVKQFADDNQKDIIEPADNQQDKMDEE